MHAPMQCFQNVPADFATLVSYKRKFFCEIGTWSRPQWQFRKVTWPFFPIFENSGEAKFLVKKQKQKFLVKKKIKIRLNCFFFLGAALIWNNPVLEKQIDYREFSETAQNRWF